MNTKLRRQRGLAAVEMAIVTPVAALLLLGAGEMGRALHQYNTLSKAVRDGARYLSTNALDGSTGVLTDLSSVDQAGTKNLVVYGSPAAGTPLLPGLSTANVSITIVDTTHVRVAAAYTYQPLFAGMLNISIPATFNAASTVRAL